MAKERVITHSIEGRMIHFDVKGVEERLTLDTDQLDNGTRDKAMFHGFVQKVSDAAALEKGATAVQKAEAMSAVISQLYAGEWNRKAVRAPSFNVGDVVLALARTKTGGDVDKANRVIDATAAKRGIGREEAAKLFVADATVGAEYDRIRRDRAPKPAFDADEALLDFDTAPEDEDEATTDEEVTVG